MYMPNVLYIYMIYYITIYNYMYYASCRSSLLSLRHSDEPQHQDEYPNYLSIFLSKGA